MQLTPWAADNARIPQGGAIASLVMTVQVLLLVMKVVAEDIVNVTRSRAPASASLRKAGGTRL